jgi:hypothetical protein
VIGVGTRWTGSDQDGSGPWTACPGSRRDRDQGRDTMAGGRKGY